jgi:hypothetical protein
MSAGAAMERPGIDARKAEMTARGIVARRRVDDWWKPRGAVWRLDAGSVVLIGFTAGMGWVNPAGFAGGANR